MGGEGEEPPPPLLNWTSGRWRRDPELKAVAAVAGDASEQERVEVCVFGVGSALTGTVGALAAGSRALSPESRTGREGGRRRDPEACRRSHERASEEGDT